MKIPLIGSSNPAFSTAVSEQQSMNCYVETIQTPAPESKNKAVLRGRPGIHLFKDLTTIDAGATPVRGIWSGAGRCFVAAGTKFFEINSSGALVGGVSTIANDGNPVDIIPNGNQLFIVSGGTSYYNNGAGVTAITLPGLSGVVNIAGANVTWVSGDTFDIGLLGQVMTIGGVGQTVTSVINPNFVTVTPGAAPALLGWTGTPIMNAGRGAFLDGYYIVNRPSSAQFNISGLRDGSSWSQLDFGIKEGYPDALKGVWSEPPLLYLLGSETLEVWRNTGNASFPLERVDGGFARVGLAAIWSCVSIAGKLHMLAGGTYGQTIAVRMDGATPVPVSTPAVAEAFNAAPSLAASGTSFSYVDRGHWFWVINFGASSKAWVYDATESALQGQPVWHQRAAWNGATLGSYVPWFHTFIPEWGPKHIVGDAASGKLYEMNSDFFDDDSSDIRYVRALPYVYIEGKRVIHHRIEFELETGTAATPPVVTLDWSDDRGQTFGTGAGVGTTRTLGPGVTATYSTRYWCVGLGSSRGRIYRITITGQGRLALIDAVLDATVCKS